jgi:hypothetical protein
MDEHVIYRIGDNIFTAFRILSDSICQHDDESACDKLADILLIGFDDMILVEPPTLDPTQPVLPFHDPHRITAEYHHVAGGGMQGGPTIDLLIQIWLETETMACAYAMPLVIRIVPSAGPIPGTVWADMRASARILNRTTPSAVYILMSRDGTFQTPLGLGMSAYALPAIHVEGITQPPRAKGKPIYAFCNDLAAGWGADPQLSGMFPSPVMDEFLNLCHIARIVRLTVRRVSGPERPETRRPA